MTIKATAEQSVARIEIARPEKKNAMTAPMYQAMADAIAHAEADEAVRALLICGQADVFTAGNDLQDFLSHPPSGEDAPVFAFMRALHEAKKPVLAAVCGAAVGIGTTMLMHCDLVYCADNAMFSMPFVSLGLCPEFGSSVLVTLGAGYHRAAEKLLLGEPISAPEALEMGMVNRLLPPGEVEAYAMRQAQRLAALPAAALRETKRLLRAPWADGVQVAMREEIEGFGRLLASDEAKAIMRSFLERRAQRCAKDV